MSSVKLSENKTKVNNMLAAPSPEEVARVLAGTARRIARLLASRAEGDDDALARDDYARRPTPR